MAKEDNASLVTDVLICLSGNNSYTWVAPVFVPLQLGLLPGQERYSSRDSLNTAQAGEAVLNEWTCIGQVHFFI